MEPADLSILLNAQRRLNDVSMQVHGVNLTSGERDLHTERNLGAACEALRDAKAALEKTLEKFRAK